MAQSKYTLETVAAKLAAHSAKSRAAKRVHRCAKCGASFSSADTAAKCVPAGTRVPRDGAYHQASTTAQRTERARKRALVSQVLTLDKLQRVMADDEA